ncbi:hypothetical protein, partial [Pseudomonas syringae group genomosp. 7]|uniref:hypothetical protein n=1 Tax=Pseudomonas syringae group genomosp. 7 TaxID=251699 RepID=UPI0037703EC2
VVVRGLAREKKGRRGRPRPGSSSAEPSENTQVAKQTTQRKRRKKMKKKNPDTELVNYDHTKINQTP